MIYMETERLILRDYTMEDREAYFKLKSDEKTMYYLQDIQLRTMDEAREELKVLLADMDTAERKYYFFHTELKFTHEQLGSVGYTVTDFTPMGKLAGAGYFLYPGYWNKGYVTEAFQRVLQFAFEENDVYRITTGCLTENKGSERVMIKCGMVKEAEHLDWEWHDGRFKDRVEYRMLRREWQMRF